MASFDERIREMTRLLRDQASEDVARVSRFREIEAQEQAARFGLGGVSASRVQGVQQESADRLVSALRQADLFGAQQSAQEQARVDAFNRQAALRRELQQKELDQRQRELQARIDAVRESRPSALGTFLGAAANIGGTLLTQKMNPFVGIAQQQLAQSQQLIDQNRFGQQSPSLLNFGGISPMQSPGALNWVPQFPTE